jgi:imidazolonepropionase-like amidohydrolase
VVNARRADFVKAHAAVRVGTRVRAHTSARALAFTCLLLVAGAAATSAQTIAITGGKVYPVSGPVLDGATVLIRDGRIAAVGRDVAVPADARLVDAAGKWVTPGLFDSNSQLGLVEISAYEDTTEGSVEDDRITAAFDVLDGLDPLTTPVAVTRVDGITRAVVVPAVSKSIIAGRAALIHLGGDSVDPLSLAVVPRVAMVAVLGARGAQLSGGARGGAMMRLREALEDARDFAANRRAWDTGARRDYALSRLDLEALAPVVRGEMPLAIVAHKAGDLVAALRLREELPALKLVLFGAADGWMVADRLAAAGVPVVIDPMSNIPGFDRLGSTLENASRLHRAGVDLLLASFDAHNARNLRQAAGNAVSYGMPWEAALHAVTLGPARAWGIADRYGSLEAGKEADVVVWDGDPFELMTTAERVFIRGREMPRDNRQRELLRRYRDLSQPLPPAYRP